MKGWAYVALASVIFLQNKGKNHKPTSQTNIKMGACPYRRVPTHKTGQKHVRNVISNIKGKHDSRLYGLDADTRKGASE
jgi:hypothetical protein